MLRENNPIEDTSASIMILSLLIIAIVCVTMCIKCILELSEKIEPKEKPISAFATSTAINVNSELYIQKLRQVRYRSISPENDDCVV